MDYSKIAITYFIDLNYVSGPRGKQLWYNDVVP